MTTPPISALPAAPSRSMTAEAFVTAADALMGALPTFVDEANTLAEGCDADAVATAADRAVAASAATAAATAASTATAAAAQAAAVPVTPATSSSTVTIASSGSKSFTLNEAGKTFAIGQNVKATSSADITRYMIGTITAFSGVSMTIDVEGSGGSGSISSWTIALIPPIANVFAGGTTITGSNKQNVVAMAALDIDLSAADFFTKSISANSTFTLSNPTAATGQVVILELTISSAAVPTWPTGGGWGGSVVPTLGNGRHLIALISLDGWSSWTGVVLSKARG
jgi:hypothetical protein